MEEKAIQTWPKIAEYLGVSRAKAITLKDELIEAGAIFYIRRRGGLRPKVAAFPSRLRLWTSLKAQRGEAI